MPEGVWAKREGGLPGGVWARTGGQVAGRGVGEDWAAGEDPGVPERRLQLKNPQSS